MGSQGPEPHGIAEWTRFESVSAFANEVRIVWQGRRALHLVMEVRGVTFRRGFSSPGRPGTIIPAASDAAIVDLARYTDNVTDESGPAFGILSKSIARLS